jgi:predicted DNA-binding ArsR family transcriptional regulator
LLTLALAAESLAESHASYAERSATLMMGLTSIQGLITKETKPGHPLEENLRKVSEIIESTRQVYAKSGEKLNAAILTQKEFEPLLEKVRSSFAQYNS